MHAPPKAETATRGRGRRTPFVGRVRSLMRSLGPDFGIQRQMWFNAARNGNLAIITDRINAGFPHVDARGPNGRTALWLASKSGHVSVVSALLEAGAATDIPDVGLDNFCALHWAVLNSHVEVVRALVEAGAHVQGENWYGRTPYDLCHVSRDATRREELQALLSSAGGGRIALGLPLLVGFTPNAAVEASEGAPDSPGRGALSPFDTRLPPIDSPPTTPEGGMRMLAPPGAPPGTMLLVRVSNGREWRVAVPESTDEEGGFTVAGANLLPPPPPAEHAPSYGRPIGVRMPRLDELVDEMAVEHVLELAKPAPSPLETMETIARALADPAGAHALTRRDARARAAVLARRGLVFTDEVTEVEA